MLMEGQNGCSVVCILDKWLVLWEKLASQYKINTIITTSPTFYILKHSRCWPWFAKKKKKIHGEFYLIYLLKDDQEISKPNDVKEEARRRIFLAQDLA